MKSISRYALFLIVLVGAAAGPALAGGIHPKTGEPLADNQTFVYRMLDEPSSLDPQLVEDVAGEEVVRDLFEGLLNQDENGNLVAGVATGYALSADRKTYRFQLRKTARWSNGEPVTAGDFVYAWRRAADPATASPYQWFMGIMALENVDAVIAGDRPAEALGVAAPDDHTLEVRLSTPLPYFPQMTTSPVTFPVPRKTVETFGDTWTRPEHIVSNGAYTLAEHSPGKRVVRVRNRLYWDNANTILERVEARVIEDENEAITQFFSGEIDRTEVPLGLFKKFRATNPDEVISFPRLCGYYYAFNLSDKGPAAFKDKRVRQGLSLAIDRSVITEDILGGGQSEAYTFTPPFVAGFDPPKADTARMTQAERDEMARALLTAAGYGAGHPLSFRLLYNTSAAHKRIAEAIAQMWKEKLGVEASLADMEWQTFLKIRQEHEFDIARGGWCGDYNEASTFLDLVNTKSGYNDAGYSNPEVDKLLAEAKTMDNPQPNYTKIEEIIAHDMPIIPVYFYANVYMMNPAILGSWPVNNIEANWYSKDLYKVAM